MDTIQSRTHQTFKYHSTFSAHLWNSTHTQTNIPLHQFTDTAQHQQRDRTHDNWIRHLEISDLNSGFTTQNTTHTHTPQEGLPALLSMMTYVLAAMKNTTCPTVSWQGTEAKLPSLDFIHRTGYNPTQGANKPHPPRNNQEGKHRH